MRIQAPVIFRKNCQFTLSHSHEMEGIAVWHPTYRPLEAKNKIKEKSLRENLDTGWWDGFPSVSAEPAATMGFAMCGAAEAPVEAEPEAGDQPPIHRRPNLPTGHLPAHVTWPQQNLQRLKLIEINQILEPGPATIHHTLTTRVLHSCWWNISVKEICWLFCPGPFWRCFIETGDIRWQFWFL